MFCRAFSTQMLQYLLYGGYTPAYVLIRLSAFILHRLSSFTHPKSEPTAISLPFIVRTKLSHESSGRAAAAKLADATARNCRRYSKESPTLQRGIANATARNCQRYSKESPTPREASKSLMRALGRNVLSTSFRRQIDALIALFVLPLWGIWENSVTLYRTKQFTIHCLTTY